MQPGFYATGSIRFRTTAWSVLLNPRAEDRAATFEYLFRTYWRPVYAYYRRAFGLSAEQACDLTQGLFLRLMSQPADLTPERGRFRSFLKVAARNHMHDQRKRKAGDGAFAPSHWSALMDAAEPIDPSPEPDRAFESEFAQALLAGALSAFEQDCIARGTERWFEVVHLRYLDPPEDGVRGLVAAIAERMELTPQQVSRLIYKARQGLKRHLLQAVRETLPVDAADEQVREEAAELFSMLEG